MAKGEKVKLAILDRDLRARVYKNFPITEGGRINVISAGKGYFSPQFDNDCCIKLPYRSLASPWKQSFRDLYIAVRGADSCFKFRKIPNSLNQKIKTLADLQEMVIATTDKENPNPEAENQLKEVLNIIEQAGSESYLNFDPKQVIDASNAEIIRNFGKQKQQTPTGIYILLIINILMNVVIMRVLGVM